MHRVDGDNVVEVKPTPRALGTQGYFSEGNPSLGQQATKVTYEILNSLMDEIANVVEEAGLTLDKEDDTQLLTAIQSLISNPIVGSYSANGAIDADDDIVLLDCTGGNRIFDVPAVESVPTRPKKFIRIDNTSNTCTLQKTGDDTIMDVTSITLDYKYASIQLFPYEAGDVWVEV